MNFVDKVTVKVAAGNGGNGAMSFRHEKFISKGGPDGGDGGRGGDVVFEASRNQNTLAAFRYQKELTATAGQPGDKRRRHGKNGGNLLVKVPVGTIASHEDGQLICDLTADGQVAVVAKGGDGGFGNAHFVSSTRQAPKFAEKGEPGEAFNLVLELKMIADVGLVGLPNAGKSTLLSKISNARPEIADYPFTTLRPNLGVVDVGGDSLLFADIPGLIDGAAEGKGLGHDFLRHIERTAVIVQVIDAYDDDIVRSYRTVQTELHAYSQTLKKLPVILAINKTEGMDKKSINNLTRRLKKVAPRFTAIIVISAVSGEGLKELLYAAKKAVIKVRKNTKPEKPDETIPVITLKDTSDEWHVVKEADVYLVSGPKIEKFARRTNYDNQEAITRLKDVMRRMGVLHELERQGIKPGQPIQVKGGESFPY